ncbi:hypothetical protein EDD21DRAFT_350999 [Dissophora ornata]|nr:hypothetical protein EDD21DRAFT_350999 [Dissophora ornata]
MVKHDRQSQSRSLAPLVRSSSRGASAPPTRASEARATAEAESSTTVKKSFWTTPGMPAFIDWLTDPYNYSRLHNKYATSGQKVKDIHKEIAMYINDAYALENIVWSEEQVKSKIQYIKQKYKDAKNMTLIGEGSMDSDTLRARLEKICPPFERLDAVMGSSLSANTPPFTRSTAILNDEIHTAYSENDLSDIDELESNSDILSVSSIQLRSQDEQRNEVRQREQAIELGELQFIERLLRIEADLRQHVDAELAAKKEQFKKEMAEEKDEFKQERRQFEQKREHYYELIAENRALKKELEMRLMKLTP